MAKIKVANTSTKKEALFDIDNSALLSTVRTRLGSFMKKDEAFLGKDGKPISAALEKTTKLKTIQADGDANKPSIKIGKAKTNTQAAEPVEAESEGGSEEDVDESEDGSDEEDDGEDEVEEGEEENDEGEGEEESETEGEGEGEGDSDDEDGGGSSPKPLNIPKYNWEEDYVGTDDRLLVNGEEVKADRITQMKPKQVRALLKANNIDEAPVTEKEGLTSAFNVSKDGDLERARSKGIVYSQLDIRPPDTGRFSTVSFQYNKVEARMHMNSTYAGSADIGIPNIFRIKSSYSQSSAFRIDERTVTEHKSYSHIIPRARVVFDDDKVRLSPGFIHDIKKAVESAERERARNLLDTLTKFGEFFASDLLLGGRLIYWTDKKLHDNYTASEDRKNFELEASGQARVNGVPIQGKAGYQQGSGKDQEQTIVHQTGMFQLKIVGGDTNQTTPEAWIPTLARYTSWLIAGFNANSLVPTLNYLGDHALHAKCIKILRNFFLNSLAPMTTEMAGATHSPRYGPDVNDDVKRIVKIDVNHGTNLDGLCVTYELKNGQHKEMPWVGFRKGEHNDTVGPLAFDEEITEIETYTGDDNLLRRVAFHTNKGRRFPESPSVFYGRAHDGEKLQYRVIRAPRVCGIVGHSGRIVDSIGLRYRDLPEGLKSRQFLLTMEPALFPLNFPSTIDMTLRGVLLAGGWRSEDQLDQLTTEDKRNTLIVELGAHSNHDGGYLQGLRNEVLIDKAAIVVSLKNSRKRDRDWLKAHSFQDHRDDLIDRINSITDEDPSNLRRLNDQQLVRWGSAL